MNLKEKLSQQVTGGDRLEAVNGAAAIERVAVVAIHWVPCVEREISGVSVFKPTFE